MVEAIGLDCRKLTELHLIHETESVILSGVLLELAIDGSRVTDSSSNKAISSCKNERTYYERRKLKYGRR